MVALLLSGHEGCRDEGIPAVRGNLLWVELSHNKHSHCRAGEAPPSNLQEDKA